MVTGNDRFNNATAGGMHGTHYSHNDYYEKEKTVEGRVFGNMGADVGLEERRTITSKEFKDVAENRHAGTGEKLTREVEGRRPFCDLTVSVPKSWSIQAIVAGDQRILGYHRAAKEKVKAELYKLVGRQAHNGTDHLEYTGKLVGVEYEHDTSRCMEPQLHTHLVIWNVTRSGNGKLYAIDFREFLDWSKYLTAVYRDELARLATQDGFNVTIGERGEPQITELMEMSKDFQQRSDELELVIDRIEEYAGLELNNRERAAIVRASRGLDLDAFKKQWDARKGEFARLKTLDSATAEAARRELLEAFAKMVRDCSDGRLSRVSTDEVRNKQRQRVTPEQWQVMDQLKATREIDRAQEHKPDLDEAIDHAIQKVFERESVIKTYELYEAIVQHAQGLGIDLEEMKARVARDPSLVMGMRQEIGSARHYQLELENVLTIDKGRGKGIAITLDGISSQLSEAQFRAVKSLLESRDQFTAVSGSAGVGKTEFVVASVIEQNVKDGHQVFIVAPSDGARDVLRKDAGKLTINSPAAAVLKTAESLQLYQADPRLRQKLRAGDLLIIDEASFLSLEQGHRVLEEAAQRGVRICFVGDLDQGKSIEAGDFFRQALQAGIHTAELHDIKRQSPEALEGHYLKAVKLFKAGRTTQAFHELYLAGCIRELRGQDRVEAIADSIIRSQEEGISAIAVNLTHRENDAVADRVRVRMKAAGRLSDARPVAAYRTLGWSLAEKRDIDKLKPGMVIEQNRGREKGRAWVIESVENGRAYARSEGKVRYFDKSHATAFDVCEERTLELAVGDEILMRSASKPDGIINGERLRIAGWDQDGNPVVSDGRVIKHRNFCYGYASTIYRVQGDSAAKVIVSFDRHSIRTASRESAYVGASRGRKLCEVYVEQTAELAGIQNRSGNRKSVMEMAITLDQKLQPELGELLNKLETCHKSVERMVAPDIESKRAINAPVKTAGHCGRRVDLQPGARKRPPEFHMEQIKEPDR